MCLCQRCSGSDRSTLRDTERSNCRIEKKTMAAPKVLGVDAAMASVLLKPVGIFNLTSSQWKTHIQSSTDWLQREFDLPAGFPVSCLLLRHMVLWSDGLKLASDGQMVFSERAYPFFPVSDYDFFDGSVKQNWHLWSGQKCCWIPTNMWSISVNLNATHIT